MEKVELLSPQGNSLVAKNLSIGTIFTWAIPTPIVSGAASALTITELTLFIFPHNGSTPIQTFNVLGRSSYDVSSIQPLLEDNTTYDWQITGTCNTGPIASEKEQFLCKVIDIGNASATVWPDGPDGYEYIGSRTYFEALRTNALTILTYLGENDPDTNDLLDALNNELFYGEIVPNRADFLLLEEVIHQIESSKLLALSEVDELVFDDLGAEDIHKIYSYFEKITKVKPITPAISITKAPGAEPAIIDTQCSAVDGVNENTISWGLSEYDPVSYRMNALSGLDGIAFGKINYRYGYDDAFYQTELYYPSAAILSGVVLPTNGYKDLYKESRTHRQKENVIFQTIDGFNNESENGNYSYAHQDGDYYVLDEWTYEIEYLRASLLSDPLVLPTGSDILQDWTPLYKGSFQSYKHVVMNETPYYYYYRIRGIDKSGTTTEFETHFPAVQLKGKTLVPPTPPPATPTVRITSRTDRSIEISWDPVPNATSYNYKIGSVLADTELETYPFQNTTLTKTTFTNLSPNVIYYMFVQSKNSGGVSDWVSISSSVAAPVLTAPKPYLVSKTTSSFQIAWPAVPDATTYERKIGSTGAVTTASATSFSASSLAPATKYDVYVRAKNTTFSVASPWAMFSVTTNALPKLAKPSITITKREVNSITLSWKAVSGATSYNYKIGSGAVKNTRSLSVALTGLSASTSYTIYVQAIGLHTSYNPSDWAVVTAATLAPTQYTTTWESTWTQTYRHTGTFRTDYRAEKLGQGEYVVEPWGIMRSLIGFGNIAATLEGATIVDVQLFIHNEHWYYYDGGTLVVGYHNHSSKPTTFSHSVYGAKTQEFTARGQSKWIDLPNSFAQGIRDGDYKGISVFANTDNMNYYGIFSGANDGTNKPKLKITYTK